MAEYDDIPITSLAHSSTTGRTVGDHHDQYLDAEALAAVEAETTLALAGSIGLSGATPGSGGIAFPAIQVADAGANVLDDHEEGSWTPTLQDDSRSDAESQTYTSQLGGYVKRGSRVAFDCHIEVNSLGSLTGANNAKIAGLPFTSRTLALYFSNCSLGIALSLAITAEVAVGAVIGNNSDIIDLIEWTLATGTAFLTVTKVSAGGRIQISGEYDV